MKRATFAPLPSEPLDLLKPPVYEIPEEWWDQARSDVEQMINRLRPDALDAGSREVLHNFINARVAQALADLKAARDDRVAIAKVLVGMASEEVARRAPRYEADLARTSHARTALAVAFEALTGRPAVEYVAVAPAPADDGTLYSTVPAIDLRLTNPDPDAAKAGPPIPITEQSDGDEPLNDDR
jgi:hypothetical protein